jgi:hypothetical protein
VTFVDWILAALAVWVGWFVVVPIFVILCAIICAGIFYVVDKIREVLK